MSYNSPLFFQILLTIGKKNTVSQDHTASLHSRPTKESMKKSAIKGGGVACSELQLLFILSNFVDHMQQNFLSLKIMLLYSASSDRVHVWASPDSMSLWIFCCYGCNFIDLQQYCECFVDDLGNLQFQETNVKMVAFAQVFSCLPRTSAGSCWEKMTVDLLFQVKTNLYDEEDLTRPQDFFLCNKLLFMVVELVGIDQV